MTVVFKNVSKVDTFSIQEIAWAHDNMAEAFVKYAIASQTEAHVDMICDTTGEYDKDNRDELQSVFNGVKEMSEDLLNDLLNDFMIKVKDKFKAAQYGAVVTGMQYGLAGDLKDISVDISVTF